MRIGLRSNRGLSLRTYSDFDVDVDDSEVQANPARLMQDSVPTAPAHRRRFSLRAIASTGLGIAVLASIVRVLAVCGFILAIAAPPARAAVQSVYGSYLTGTKSVNGNHLVGEVASTAYQIPDGRSVAVHFQVYQQAPLVDFYLAELSVALSHPANEDWNLGLGPETGTLELWSGTISGPDTMIASLSLKVTDSPAIDFESPFAYMRHTDYYTSYGNFLLSHGGHYWAVLHFNAAGTGHTLNWHHNAAGVPGLISTKDGMGAWSSPTAVFAQPVLKVRGHPINEPCPKSSFMSGAIFGPPFSTTCFELHAELLCPPAILQYYNCATLDVPANTSSFDAAGILVHAIQNSNNCGSPSGAKFYAERGGNIVRVSHSSCPCSGAYVCGDPGGIVAFAKMMGYQNEGIPMKLNLFFGGLATGVSADPLIPPGVQIIHTQVGGGFAAASPADMAPQVQVFTALFSPGAGATPADVAQGLATQLQLQGDAFVTAVGDKLRLDAPGGTGYYDVAYRINDTGLRWALAPFDAPNPIQLFGVLMPTLSELGMIALAFLLAFTGVILIRRKRAKMAVT